MAAAAAAGHELTARTAADVLAAGGNAVDATVAAAAMSWASEPAVRERLARGEGLRPGASAA